MGIDTNKIKVIHNTSSSRFEAGIGKELAVLEYHLTGKVMAITHTEVPASLEGQGIASQLAQSAFEYAREKSYRVIPACEFIVVYLKKHPEYTDLVEGY